MILYKVTTNKNITIVQFRTALIELLLQTYAAEVSTHISRPRRLKHELKKKVGLAKTSRKYYVRCY